MKEHIRKYLLLTLSHSERRNISSQEIIEKIHNLFKCKQIIVAQELHQDHGTHYHIGILNESASRYTAAKLLRKTFPMFDGKQINVTFHKGWNTICHYLLKQDKTPACWGTSLPEVQLVSESVKKKTISYPQLLERLKTKEDWTEVLTDEHLGPRCLRNYSSLKQVFADLQGIKESKHFFKRLSEYLRDKNEPKYTGDELKEKYPALEWLVFNLCRERHLKQPQLLLTGLPGTNKTNLFDILSKVLRIYSPPHRKDDFTGVDDNYDLWLFDEFNPSRLHPTTLNAILDGQPVQLDQKYGMVFKKKRNVPIVIISNYFPNMGIGEHNLYQKAFESRVLHIEFLSSFEEGLSEARLLRTFYEMVKADFTLQFGPHYVAQMENMNLPLFIEESKASVIHMGTHGPLTLQITESTKVENMLFLPILPRQFFLPKQAFRLFLPIHLKRRGRPKKKWVLPECVPKLL